MSEASLPHFVPLRYFCTYFDSNYLTRGLALYNSLRKNSRNPIVLWVLCFDDRAYQTMARLKLPDVRLITQAEFEADDPALVGAKATRSKVEYYWTCTPSLPLYILRKNPEVDLITYLDADLFFFGEPQPIYEEMEHASILIVEHRYAPEYANMAKTSGLYNVGWMSFRRDANAITCLKWWRERCLDWCYAHFEDGKFGDQLYLDDWPNRFSGVAVLQCKGASLAPWNLTRYALERKNGDLVVDGQPLIFFHFHGFRCVHERVVEPASAIYHLQSRAIVNVFLPYAADLLHQSKQLGRGFPDANQALEASALRAGLLEQRLLLLGPRVLSVWLWQVAGSRQRNEVRVRLGFAAAQRGDISAMRRQFLQAILRDPRLLCNLGIVSLLVESLVGSVAMMRYRSWRRKTRHPAVDK